MKNISQNRKDNGFTLVEMLTAIFIFTLLLVGITVLFKTILTTTTQQNLSLDTSDQARKLSFNFLNEVRTATTGNDGSFPINEASDGQIVFFSGYGASGANINRIRYFVSNGKLWKGVVVPTGNPLTYNLTGETTKPVQTALANGNTPVFFYYNENYGGTSTPLSQPVNVNQVRFVKLNLILLKQDVKGASTTFVVNAGASIRNLKTNLGN